MNKTLKFILKMVITGCFVVGVVFGVSYLITPKFDSEKIVNAESSYNLIEKFEKSYNGYTENEITVAKIVDMMPDAPSQYYTSTKTITLPASKKTNDILIVYYNYYVTISGYSQTQNSTLQTNVVNQMDKLNIQVEKTIEYLEYINSFAKRHNYSTSSYSNSSEFFKALDKWVASYQKQTELLIELTNFLREYVCETHYKTNVDTYMYIGEVKLQVFKDYANVVFFEALNNKLKTESTPSPLLTDDTNASFEKVYGKFVDKIDNVVNPDFVNLFKDNNQEAELKLYLSYGNIKSNLLYNNKFNPLSANLTQENIRAGFYQLASTYSNANYKKETFFIDGTMSGFIEYYFGENITENTVEHYDAENQFIAISALFDYLYGANL